MEHRKKGTLIAQILPILLVIGIVILSLYRFTYKNERKVKENNSTYLREISRQKTQQVNQIFEDDLNTIQSLAYLYGATMQDDQVDMTKLKEIETSTGFDYIRFVDRDGMNHATDGSVKDCSDRDYYINGMRGEFGLTAVHKSRVNGETMIGFYAPVHHEGKTVGVLVGFLSKNRMVKELDSYFYDYTGVTLVCDPDRIVVASSNEQAVGYNVNAVYNGESMMSKEEYEKATHEMRKEEGTIEEVTFQGDNGETTAYICHLDSDGWRLIQSFPSAVNMELTDSYNQYGIQMMIALAVTFGLYIIWLVITFLYNMRKSARKMKENSYQQMQMIQVLSENYGNVFCLDLRDETFDVYRVEGDYGYYVQQLEQREGAYSDIMHEYIDKCVVEEDKERMNKCFEIDELEETLCKQPSILVNYRMYNKERTESAFFSVKCARIGEADNFHKVIFGFANIDRETREEVEHKQLLEDALARAEKANQAKTIFLSNMSHDIRTPLNAIIGFSNIATTHLEDKECVKDSLDKILSSGKHLLGLINDVLDMSRIESGKVTLEETETHLSELIHNMVTLMQPQADAKQIRFQVDTYDIKDEVVYMDAIKINRVLINILGNAVKFTPEGREILMTIQQLPDAVPSGFAAYEFRIRDTGMGMKEEFLEHIFEPFERERTSTQSKIEGTGLGMAITKNIVDMMGGTITVKSKKGEGSEFTIRLELRIGEDVDCLEETKKMKGMRVLVFDKDLDNVETITNMLDAMSVTYEWTTVGKEAVLRAKKAQQMEKGFDAVIFGMDEDNAQLETVGEIREVLDEQVPIVLLSSREWVDLEPHSKGITNLHLCRKPIFRVDLVRALADNRKEEVVEETVEVDAQKTDITGKHILLVEDVLLNQQLAMMILKERGVIVDLAKDGQEAVNKMEESSEGFYDLIFMDIMMPVMDGYEAARTIRAMEREDVHSIPIIAMTANVFEDDKRKAFESGMDAHVSKPFKMEDLEKIFGKYLA